MNLLLPQLDAVARFFELGGGVLWWILATALLMWLLIIERYWYYWRVFPFRHRQLLAHWRERADVSSWTGRRILQMQVADLSAQLQQSMYLIRTLVALCPLLGLLGTVTGMIQVFDVMAITGTGNPRAMASGVSMATIPTMAGMVVALSGLYFRNHLDRRVAAARLHLSLEADSLANSTKRGINA